MRAVVKRTITAFTLGLLFWLSFIFLPPFVFSCILFGILVYILIFEWHHFFDVRQPLFWICMPFYPILPFSLMIYMNHVALYRPLLFALFILVSSHDTGSYIMGKLFGKHLIAPGISPKKTWEGFFGGYSFACIGLAFLFWEQETPIPWHFIIGFSLIVCSLSLLGDLFESWLKRKAHIKDSGSILPGHGGFLDRFDGILFAVFFFFLLRNYLIHFFK